MIETCIIELNALSLEKLVYFTWQWGSILSLTVLFNVMLCYSKPILLTFIKQIKK